MVEWSWSLVRLFRGSCFVRGLEFFWGFALFLAARYPYSFWFSICFFGSGCLMGLRFGVGGGMALRHWVWKDNRLELELHFKV